MVRNLLAETRVTYPFSHFPDDRAIHSVELRPVFEDLPERDQTWVTETVRKFDPRNDAHYAVLAKELGVTEGVAVGLMILLHPDA